MYHSTLLYSFNDKTLNIRVSQDYDGGISIDGGGGLRSRVGWVERSRVGWVDIDWLRRWCEALKYVGLPNGAYHKTNRPQHDMKNIILNQCRAYYTKSWKKKPKAENRIRLILHDNPQYRLKLLHIRKQCRTQITHQKFGHWSTPPYPYPCL